MNQEKKLKDIILTKEESKKLTENMRKSLGKNAVKKTIEKIVFHKDFEKGMRLSVCLKCGFPQIFWGKGMKRCDCKPFRQKYYSIDEIENFILKLQSIYDKRKKGGN